MRAALLLAGLATLGAGAAADLALGADRRWARTLAYLAGLAGSACLCAVGALSDLGHPLTVDLGGLFGVGTASVRLDGLAGLFLTLTSALGVAISACLMSWSGPPERLDGRHLDGRHLRGHGTAAAYLLMLGSVAVVLVAGDAFLFLFGWEALTVSFYLLTGITRARPAQASASWATLGMGKLSGAALLLAFLALAGRSGSLTISHWNLVSSGTLHAAAYALAVVGFGAKVGMVPFHVWMPVGYPAAPGPIRAAMAGLAANVGFYGLWRFLGVLGRPPLWLAVAVLLLGGVTALLGITFAAVQGSLSRLIAYSSIENAGIILVGYGVALAGEAVGRPELVAVGLLAATLQAVAHAVAKAALFVATGTLEADRGSIEIDDLGGSGRSHPWTGSALAAGALTLAGLPPTLGFVSEWFILEALMQQFRVQELGLRLAMAGAGALVALTAGVAALTFVRLVGFVVLGRPDPARSGPADGEAGALGRAGLVSLGASCFALAAASPWVIRFMAVGLAPIVPTAVTDGALKAPWVLQPVFADFSALSPTWLLVAMPGLLLATAVAAIALSRGRWLRTRRVPAWRSASGGVRGPASYTAFGYANPVRTVLANVLGTRREIEGGQAGHPTGAPRHAQVEYRTILVEPVEAYLYRPARRALLGVVEWSKRLQSGRLAAYIAYMLAALVAVLVVTVATR